MILSASESMCLEYIRRHEKEDNGLDLDSMDRMIVEE